MRVPAPTPLPPALASRPFTVAEALALGVSRDVLRGNRLRAPHRGVRVSAHLADSLELRCQAAALALPAGSAFTRATAARLCHLPVPGSWRGAPLDVVVIGQVPPRVRGVRAREATEAPPVQRLRSGLLVTTGPAIWVDLATTLDLDDLVVLGDAVLRRTRTDLDELVRVVRASRGRRGVRALREALPLLEPRTDSPMETRLRLLIVRAGLPRPVANRDVLVDGGWVARPDLSYPSLKIAIEYDGDHHRTDRQQWRNDKARRHVLEEDGWLVLEFTADDVLARPQLTVMRISRSIARREAATSQ